MQMKKFTKLFTACLAFFMCLGTAWAQEEETVSLPVIYMPGDAVAEITSGTEVFMQAAGSSKYQVGKYLTLDGDKAGNAALTGADGLVAKSIWVFELVEGEKCDGHEVFRLKNKATGLYVKAVDAKDLPEKLNDDGSAHEWNVQPKFTDKVEEAFKATVLHPLGFPYEEDGRQSSSQGNAEQTYVPESWVITDVTDYPLIQGGLLYFCHYLWIAMYQDTNQWTVGEVVTESDPQYVLASVIQGELFPNGIDAAYIAGTNPGQYDPEKVAALKEAYDAALAIQPGASYDVCNAAYIAVVNAKKACEESLVKVQDGKSYFVIYQRSSNGNAMYASTDQVRTTESYVVPTVETATANDGKYIWKVIADEDGRFFLQNYYNDKYVSIKNENYTPAPLTDEPEISFTFQTGVTVADGFKLVGSNDQRLHSQGNGDAPIVRWNDGDAAANYAKFIPADDVAVALTELVAQNKLNAALQDVYNTAKAVYDKGFVFGFFADSVFHTNDGLVTSPTQLSTNAQEATEGPIAGLLDGDFSTYFHSDWHGNYSDVFHYIQADLGEAVDGVVLKYAKRANNNNNDKPGEFRISVTNDPTGEWEELGDFVLEYQYSNTAVAGAGAEVKATFAGSIEVPFSGNYQHIRLECIKTTGMVANNEEAATGTMIQMSEMRFFKVGDNGIVETNALKNVPADIRTTLETTLATAEAELEAGAATQATIDALKAAYDAFANEFADLDVLRNAIVAASEVYADESYPLGTALGEFDGALKENIKKEIDAQQALVDAGNFVSKEQIAAGKAALEAAVEAFVNSVVMPEAGHYYVLRGVPPTDGSTANRSNAPIYSIGNSETEALHSLTQAEGGVDVANWYEFLNMLWKVEACADGKITLRNVGTGFYMGTQAEILSGGVPNVKEAVALGIQGAKVSGAFNIIVGEHKDHGTMYINFAGGGNGNMVAWNSANGVDNSAVAFEDVTDELDNNFLGSSMWYLPGGEGAYILTLPYSVVVQDLYGEVYTVAGMTEDVDAEESALHLMANEEEYIPAGEPFVFIPDVTSLYSIGGRHYFSLSPANGAADDYVVGVADMEYVTEGKTNGCLVGTLTAMPTKEEDEYTAADLIPNESVIFVGGEAEIVGGNTSIANRLSKANAGYVLKNLIDEDGDLVLPLEGLLSTGINGVVANGNANADVYSISGVKVRKNTNTKGLPSGVYVVGGKKVLVK